MSFQLDDLIVNPENFDVADIFSTWQWRLHDQKGLVFISKLGDMFLLGEDDAVYWLQTDSGDLTKIAETLAHFEQLLTEDENLDNWFLPALIDKLEAAGKILKPNEVYSYRQLPVIGGEYAIENIEPADASVHFAFTGQICEQIQNLPDGTKVKLTFKKNSRD